MKKLIFILLVMMGFGLSAQVVDDGTKSRYPNRAEVNAAFGTKVGQDSLRAEMPLKLNADSAAAKYVNKLTDGFVLTDSFYTKTEINVLEQKLYKDERTYSFLKLGADTLFFPIGSTGNFSSAAYSLVDNTATIMSYDITTPSRWRGVKFVPSATGNATWDGWNGFVLLDSSGTRIDSTANTPWTQATGNVRTVDFVNKNVLQPGVYYIIQISNWVGAPVVQPAVYTLSGANAVQNYLISSSHKFSSTLVGQTTNPSSINISSTTNSSTYPGFVPYE